MKIRVTIVATGAIARSGLAATIATSPDIIVVGTANNLAELMPVVERSPPDVILFDLGNLPPTLLWELVPIQELQDRAMPTIVIDRFERLDVNVAIRAGVRGILTDTSTEAELVAAVSAVAAGLVVIDPSAIDSFLREPNSSGDRERERLEFSLTPREIEVLVRLGSGLGNKAIAQGLQISEHTVKFHISSIFQKLGVSTRTEAVAMGIRIGLILV